MNQSSLTSTSTSNSFSVRSLTFNICFLCTLSLWIPIFIFAICTESSIPFMTTGIILFFLFLIASPFIGMGLYLLKKIGMNLEDISLLCMLSAWLFSQAMGIFCFDLGLEHTIFALILGGGSHLSLWLAFRIARSSTQSQLSTHASISQDVPTPSLHTEHVYTQTPPTEADVKENLTHSMMYVI